MRVEVLPDAAGVAERAAVWIAAAARDAVAARGRFLLAVSGGKTPWGMLRALLGEEVPWAALHLFQVDERVAPSGHPDRNLTRIREILDARLPARNLHPMPVEAPDLAAAAVLYARELETLAGAPPVFDLVQLGLGEDGHTASLLPGDPVLDVTDADVATAGPYQGRTRLTLTYPVLDRAREILWVVTGAEKAPMLARLRAGDATIPGGRVRRDRARVFADRAAAADPAAGS